MSAFRGRDGETTVEEGAEPAGRATANAMPGKRSRLSGGTGQHPQRFRMKIKPKMSHQAEATPS